MGAINISNIIIYKQLSTYFFQSDGVELLPEDSNFIGAWWLGYIVGGLLSILVSLPLIAFPSELPGTSEIRAEKQDCTDFVEDHNMPHTLKQLLPSLKSLLTNKAFVCLSLAAAFEGFAVGGFSTFLPKFVEAQFRLPAGTASTFTGAVVVPGGCGGMLFGGYLIKRMKWTCDKIIRACFIIACLATLWAFGMFLGCPNRAFAGVTHPYVNRYRYLIESKYQLCFAFQLYTPHSKMVEYTLLFCLC